VKKLIFLFCILAFSCSENKETKNVKSNSVVQKSKENSIDQAQSQRDDAPEVKSQYTYKVIGTASNYGYQIFDVFGKMMINQPTIPAIQGNKGFLSEKDAQTAAEFVIKKMDKGIFPPTFSVAELDSLGLKH